MVPKGVRQELAPRRRRLFVVSYIVCNALLPLSDNSTSTLFNIQIRLQSRSLVGWQFINKVFLLFDSQTGETKKNKIIFELSFSLFHFHQLTFPWAKLYYDSAFI